jgi:hypothetical protein
MNGGQRRLMTVESQATSSIISCEKLGLGWGFYLFLFLFHVFANIFKYGIIFIEFIKCGCEGDQSATRQGQPVCPPLCF